MGHHPGASPKQCQRLPVSTQATTCRNRPQTQEAIGRIAGRECELTIHIAAFAFVRAKVQHGCVSLCGSDSGCIWMNAFPACSLEHCVRSFASETKSQSNEHCLHPPPPLYRVVMLLTVNDRFTLGRFAPCQKVMSMTAT